MTASSPPPRRTRSWSARALLLACLPAAACSVAANLSADEILTEVDAIVRIEGSGRDLQLRYAERAQVAMWYTRAWLTQPVRWPLVWVFGRTGEQVLEDARRHVRELLLELPDEVGGDLLVAAKAASRLAWMAQLETSSHSRIVAIDGLAAIAQDLGLGLFAGNYTSFGVPADPARLAVARAGVQAGRPDVRPAAVADGPALSTYADALAQLTQAPLEDALARLALLEEVAGLFAAETADSIRTAVAASLRSTLGHAIEGLLVDIVQSRAPDSVDLRLCAMEQIRRLGGPRTVPLLLAVMAASPAQLARGEERYDPDPLVQLRLIQYCGQLRGELALTAARLPGRQGFESFAPADFLAITILTQPDYYSKLRTPALVALSWSLQRPRFDPDLAWVKEWRDQRR